MKHEELTAHITAAVTAAAQVQMAALLESVSQSRAGVTLEGAESRPVAAAGAGSGQDASYGNTAGVLRGYTFRETTGGAAAGVELRDGGPSGDLICPVNLAAGASTTVWLGDGVAYVNGLYLVRVAGSVDGALWLGGTR